MPVSEVLNTRCRVSDPKPGFCAACYCGADDKTVFIDFDALFDSGQLVTERDGLVISRVPGDELHLCAACIKAGAEALGLKPELHTRQAREIRKLELQVEHFKDENRRLREIIGKEAPDVRRTK